MRLVARLYALFKFLEQRAIFAIYFKLRADIVDRAHIAPIAGTGERLRILEHLEVVHARNTRFQTSYRIEPFEIEGPAAENACGLDFVHAVWDCDKNKLRGSQS